MLIFLKKLSKPLLKIFVVFLVFVWIFSGRQFSKAPEFTFTRLNLFEKT
jgi:hypothetical protein